MRTMIDEGQQPTKKQAAEIEAASRRPIVFDEEAPELTPEQYAEMAQIARARREEQKKPVVASAFLPNLWQKPRPREKDIPAS